MKMSCLQNEKVKICERIKAKGLLSNLGIRTPLSKMTLLSVLF